MSASDATFECESTTLQQYSTPRRNLKAYGAIFGLGMIAGMFGLVAAEHYGLVDSSVTSSFFAPAIAVIPTQEDAFVPSNPLPEVNAGRTRAATNIRPPASPGVAQSGPRVRTDLEMVRDFQEDGAEPGAYTPCKRRSMLLKAAAAAAAMAGMRLPALAATTLEVKMGTDNGQLIFEPAKIKVCVGDTVKWTNNKAGPHNVVFKEVPAGADAEELGMEENVLLNKEGETFQATLADAGKYKYICAPHGSAGMVGEITVEA